MDCSLSTAASGVTSHQTQPLPPGNFISAQKGSVATICPLRSGRRWALVLFANHLPCPVRFFAPSFGTRRKPMVFGYRPWLAALVLGLWGSWALAQQEKLPAPAPTPAAAPEPVPQGNAA